MIFRGAYLVLLCGLTTASLVPTWGSTDGDCLAFQAVAPGKTTVAFYTSAPENNEPGQRQLALLNYFPNRFFRQIAEGSGSTLLRHYEDVIQILRQSRQSIVGFPTNPALLIEALTAQKKWLSTPSASLHVPALRHFIELGNVGALEELYTKTALSLIAAGKLVPYTVPHANEYYLLKRHESPLQNVPPEILAAVNRVHRDGLLTNLEFNKFVADIFTHPFLRPEEAIGQIIHKLRTRFTTTVQSVNAIKADLASGALSETDLAAYLAFYYPELVQRALVVNKLSQNDDVHEWLKKGLFTSRKLRGRLGRETDKNIAARLGLAELETQGWNMRDPQRETALALAYLSGENKLAVFDPPVSLPQNPLLTLKETVRVSEPAPITVAFVSPPKPPMEALAPIHFATADSHSLLTGIDSLAMAHLDITASLRDAQQRFKASEENNDQPALARVVALLQKENPGPEEITNVLGAVKTLLALNAAKLKHLSEIKGHSAELVDLMNKGVESYEAAAKEFPAIEGASSAVVSKVNAGLEALSALRSTAKNSESVDRSISELEAQIAEERKTFQKIALVLGNPLTFQETRVPLAVDLETLGHNGH